MTSWLYQTLARIRALFAKPHLDRQLEEEIDTHIEMATEENIQRGMEPGAARRKAILMFGSRDASVELHREVRGLPLAENLIQDVRHGARLLARNPLFALTAALSLAIGIGAGTTIFISRDFVVSV